MSVRQWTDEKIFQLINMKPENEGQPLICHEQESQHEILYLV